MPILRPDEYQPNNQNTAIVDSNFLRGGGRVVSDLTSLYALGATKIDQLKERVTLVYVQSETDYYILKDITNVSNVNGWELFLGNLQDQINTLLPYGLEGQIMRVNNDNTNKYDTEDTIIFGAYINTDEELEAAKTTFISRQAIFNTWKRFSHGIEGTQSGATPTRSDRVPGEPGETNSWSYTAEGDIIKSTANSSSHIGFVSNVQVRSFVLNATLGATGSDDDFITIIVAYIEDADDMVPNYAFGLNPVTYPSIDTTSALIPNQHTISLVRGRTTQDLFKVEGQLVRYGLVYDFRKLTEKLLVNGDSLIWSPTVNSGGASYFGTGQSCEAQVTREGNIITAKTTNWTDAPGGKGTLSHDLVVDMDANPLLARFRGTNKYGYGALSQANSFFINTSINDGINEIYDLRGGYVWIADANGVYYIDTTRNLFDGSFLKPRTLIANSTTGKSFYLKDDYTVFPIGKVDEEVIPVLKPWTDVINFVYNGTNNIQTLSFTPVWGGVTFLNGVVLDPATDFTYATNTIVLNTDLLTDNVESYKLVSYYYKLDTEGITSPYMTQEEVIALIQMYGGEATNGVPEDFFTDDTVNKTVALKYAPVINLSDQRFKNSISGNELSAIVPIPSVSTAINSTVYTNTLLNSMFSTEDQGFEFMHANTSNGVITVFKKIFPTLDSTWIQTTWTATAAGDPIPEPETGPLTDWRINSSAITYTNGGASMSVGDLSGGIVNEVSLFKIPANAAFTVEFEAILNGPSPFSPFVGIGEGTAPTAIYNTLTGVSGYFPSSTEGRFTSYYNGNSDDDYTNKPVTTGTVPKARMTGLTDNSITIEVTFNGGATWIETPNSIAGIQRAANVDHYVKIFFDTNNTGFKNISQEGMTT